MSENKKPQESRISGEADKGWQEWYPEEEIRQPANTTARWVLIIASAVGVIGLLWIFSQGTVILLALRQLFSQL